eukprot:scaffold1578_cov350-Pavlova_lutheri.AAC.3
MARLGTTSDPHTGARVINAHLCAGPSTHDDQVDLHVEGEGKIERDGRLQLDDSRPSCSSCRSSRTLLLDDSRPSYN